MRLMTVLLAALVVLLSGCASGSGAASPDPVQWQDYAPTVKTRIDDMATAKDCAGLQKEFNASDANNELTMQRTGHNNARLMKYIDKTLREAGCYK